MKNGGHDERVLNHNAAEGSDFGKNHQDNQKEKKMRVSADLTTVKGFEVLPRDIYTARVDLVDTGTEQEPKRTLWEPHNPCISLNWKIEEGDHAGREIRFDTVETGGKTKNGNPIVLFRLADLLFSLGVPWTCKNCHPDSTADRVADVIKGTGDNGFERGKLFCPDCRSPVKIDFDTANLVGRSCKIGVDIQKSKKDDREFNVIKRYAPLNGRS